MKYSLANASLFVFVVSTLACSSSSSSEDPSLTGHDTSCTQTGSEGSTCTEYINTSANAARQSDYICNLSMNKIASRCAAEGLYGCCRTSANGYSSDTCYYFAKPPTDDGVAAGCKMGGGTWSTTLP